MTEPHDDLTPETAARRAAFGCEPAAPTDDLLAALDATHGHTHLCVKGVLTKPLDGDRVYVVENALGQRFYMHRHLTIHGDRIVRMSGVSSA